MKREANRLGRATAARVGGLQQLCQRRHRTYAQRDHIGRLPRLPLSIFEPENIGGHQSLDHDHLVYINRATDRQQRACSLVRELHRLTVSRLQRRNAPIMAALLASPPFSVGG